MAASWAPYRVPDRVWAELELLVPVGAAVSLSGA